MEFSGPIVYLVVIMAAALLLPYIAGPIAVHRKVTNKLKPDLMPFPLDHPDLPELVKDHFQNVSKQLESVGFDVVQGVALPSQVPKVKAIILLFANRATKDVAIASAIYVDGIQGTKLGTAYTEIATRFRDGSIVQTSNTKQLNAFGKRPNATSTQFPMVEDAARLFRLHSALLVKYGGGYEKILRLDEEFHGDALAAVAASMREEMEAQVRTGYLYLSESEGLFRLTWKGAFFMVWKLLFPLKHIRRALREKKAQRLLREIEGPDQATECLHHGLDRL